MKTQRGFVLLNALILVAALSAVVLVVLNRSVTARSMRALDQEVAQTQLYLDSFEALAQRLLTEDGSSGAVDHAQDAWAQTRIAVPLDRGEVAGQIEDLQGRFNLNLLASSEDAAMRDSFDRLITAIGLSPGLGEQIAQYVSFGPPEGQSAYARAAVPLRPRGGPLATMEELRPVLGLGRAEFDVLSRVATVLPEDAPLNINTAPESVLKSVLPLAAARAIPGLVQRRKADPFTSVEAFFADLRANSGGDPLDGLQEDRFSIGSGWFVVQSAARLGDTQLLRQTVLHRAGLPPQLRIAYRLGQIE